MAPISIQISSTPVIFKCFLSQIQESERIAEYLSNEIFVRTQPNNVPIPFLYLSVRRNLYFFKSPIITDRKKIGFEINILKFFEVLCFSSYNFPDLVQQQMHYLHEHSLCVVCGFTLTCKAHVEFNQLSFENTHIQRHSESIECFLRFNDSIHSARFFLFFFAFYFSPRPIHIGRI